MPPQITNKVRYIAAYGTYITGMTLQGALDGAKRRQLNCGEDETSAKRPKPDAAVKLVGSHHKQGKNNKQAAFNISDADEQQKLQLLDALAQFERQMPSRQLFLEVDAVRDVDADALVGRQVRVLWPEDEAWYLGIIASFDDRTGKHHVSLHCCLPLAACLHPHTLIPM